MGHQPGYDQFNVDFLFFGRPGTFVGTAPVKFCRENIGLKCVFLEWALRKSFLNICVVPASYSPQALACFSESKTRR